LTNKGTVMAHIPRISRMLTILLPITLATARSGEPCKADKILTVSSGADVPKETTVRPITKEETRNLAAKDEAPRTNPSAPSTSSTKPIIINIISRVIAEKYYKTLKLSEIY